jgi:hypothetical protein
MKRVDKIILCSLIPLLIFSIFYIVTEMKNKNLVIIDISGEKEYNIYQKNLIHCQGKLGKVLVEIDNGRARIIESNCKDKLCIKKGWISNVGEYSICLPNEVFVIIIGKGNLDGVSE